ncbi:unnamed protein product [Leptosia nina]|uniref:Myrosinase 1-like n=1 Tax=Leptosia nina TaxID=320188 RepID=A0AAV1J3I8_9NEOP
MFCFVALVFYVSAVSGYVFPDGFKFGVATSAYQIEGGWNASGKGVSIWDTFTHQNPHLIEDGSNADVACDSYHLWRNDIDLVEALGSDFYRFSISWSRILPTGLPNEVSKGGAKYYSDIIDELLRRNIQPMVTLYHYDLPQKFQDLGGWVWRLYDEEYKPTYHGRVSLANNPVWLEAGDAKYENLAELGREFGAGRYSHPIYSRTGGWPPSVEKYMAELSRRQGLLHSRLPAFTQEEIKLIRGTYDFYALNHYTSRMIRPAKPDEKPGAWIFFGSVDLNAILFTPDSWPHTAAAAVVMYPQGIRRQMAWLQQKYGNLSFLITENGCASNTKGEHDDDRIEFLDAYLKEIAKAIEEGINVEGYTAWSLMDNFEWLSGYSVSYGLYKVDFKDPQRLRTPRASAHYYADVIKSRRLDTTNINKNKYTNLTIRVTYNIFMIVVTIVSLGLSR